MKLLVFDTETTGLPKNNPSIYQTSEWPYSVQFSFLIYDTDFFKVCEEFDYIIKLPKHIPIPEESVAIHGITKERSTKEGVPIKGVLEQFKQKLEECDIIVGHNISFDKRMVIVESIRNRFKTFFPSSPDKYYCTMKNTVDICQIERINQTTNEAYFKYPTLSELFKKLFNRIPKGFHNSMIDVYASLICYIKLKYNKNLLTSDLNLSAHFNL